MPLHLVSYVTLMSLHDIDDFIIRARWRQQQQQQQQEEERGRKHSVAQDASPSLTRRPQTTNTSSTAAPPPLPPPPPPLLPPPPLHPVTCPLLPHLTPCLTCPPTAPSQSNVTSITHPLSYLLHSLPLHHHSESHFISIQSLLHSFQYLTLILSTLSSIIP